MNHTLETNFQFMRRLKNNKELGMVQLSNPESEKIFFRSIYFKNNVVEYGTIKYPKTFELTEYKNNKAKTVTVKFKR